VRVCLAYTILLTVPLQWGWHTQVLIINKNAF
jgi:hypothetical protein